MKTKVNFRKSTKYAGKRAAHSIKTRGAHYSGAHAHGKNTKLNFMHDFYHTKNSKILAVLLAIVLVTSLIPLASYKSIGFADDGTNNSQAQAQNDNASLDGTASSNQDNQESSDASSPSGISYDFELWGGGRSN